MIKSISIRVSTLSIQGDFLIKKQAFFCAKNIFILGSDKTNLIFSIFKFVLIFLFHNLFLKKLR